MVLSKIISGIILLNKIRKKLKEKKKVEFIPYDYYGNIKRNIKPDSTHVIVYKNYRKRSKSF